MKRLYRFLLPMAALALAGTSGFAATATTNLGVSATVSANCTLTATAVGFGSYDPVSANASTDLVASGAVNANCTNGATATILLGQGLHAATGSTDAAPLRQMISGGNQLSYQLYSDANHTTVWDNSTGVSYSGQGTQTSVSVYGKVTAGQNVPSGNYADTVVATISF